MRFAPMLALAPMLVASCGRTYWEYERVKGPDGTADWFAIGCNADHSDCFKIAGRKCPYGYQVQNDQKRGRRGAQMLVHCNPMPEGSASKSSGPNYGHSYGGDDD